MSASTELVTEPSDADKAAIAAVTRRLGTAWAEHDADTFAEQFVDDATMIIAGVHRSGKDQIRDYMAEAFRGRFKGTRVTGSPIGMRALGDDVALLLTVGGVLEPGDTEPKDHRAIHASWLVVRDGGRWRLAAYQNTPVHNPWPTADEK
ncbi:SgcJ/EcaC family oxidoreductase [Umezawaea sp. Da 62-37]|uniref:SgcJ/EcaC family oxidoreductase n=1 Tax=Umezawaea sp. Da 62-37 TaxID=3075927 RepID=UPI0028F70EE8|nr:SgcJ/EcaC family oxidoreductase [Umezawaea sp. Da 62-37]WNV84547.1 SgcJ/EcaC family oxidoreductase [Umezawaea sp. Da 62-37]